MVDAALILAFVAFTLVIIGISFGSAKMHDYGRRIGALEEALKVKPHTKLARTHRDIGEQFLFDLVNLRDEMGVMQTKLDYFTKRAAHVAQGGRPDDLPTTWKEFENDSPPAKPKGAHDDQ